MNTMPTKTGGGNSLQTAEMLGKGMDRSQSSNRITPTPRVSVGMPVYNGEEFIRQSIESVLGQTFRDIELILSDNASTDATERICRDYAATDTRVHYYRNPVNVGVTDNYNKVVSYAQGEYFKYISCNDLCAPDFIKRCVHILDQRPDVVVCFAKTRLFDKDITSAEDYEDNLDLQGEDPLSRFEQFIDRIHWRLNNTVNGLIRTRALKRSQLQKPFYGSDINLMAELTLYGKFVEVSEWLSYRRMDKAYLRDQDGAQRRQVFWPQQKQAMSFQRWKTHLGYLDRVYHSPLSRGDKFKLYFQVSKRINWRKRELIMELISALK